MRKAIPTLAGLTLLVLAGAASATECRYSAPRNLDLDAASLKSLLLNLGSADAHVSGVPGLSRVEVRGTACASNEEWLKDLQLDTSHSGDSATVTVRRRDHDSIFSLFGFSRYAYMKVSVSVPPQLAVAIHSGSGDVVAQTLASLDFHSGSGDLQADGITGALTLRLGSGDVEARHVGSVELSGTGSGDVTVAGIGGDVHANHAGSGNLQFSQVQGGVWVGSVGSGDVKLENIGGDVQLGSIGSGDVVVDDVGGNLEVGSAGSGDVTYHSVRGTVHVPKDD
jgi:DUF4097 and DUF4098 domain-containing protein YvlB